ncbi:nucleotide-binding universal stress UspA family protein [Amycolatopsis lexingtonensis]|uniref:Nucleotide-binding universal stress UspA family protein n=1 Tax=Amycolatopsis lexingtonensis TaxID=218822 RepID=A0ABR9HZK0_9PSEU|nr:universal stress protein [Amycolatopsis lexingtonensis]MBE1496367.1 nucleotide-binding universal stress UspA family protein [Amycolatopsis lexingtonensis]
METPGRDDIVVGVDRSTAGEVVLGWAAAEAAVSGRRVVALRAWTCEPGYDLSAGVTGWPETAESRQLRELDEIIARVRAGLPGVRIRPEVIGHSPAVALVEASRAAAMLVLGVRRHGASPPVAVGSVADQCLREATCPVVVVPCDIGVDDRAHPDRPRDHPEIRKIPRTLTVRRQRGPARGQSGTLLRRMFALPGRVPVPPCEEGRASDRSLEGAKDSCGRDFRFPSDGVSAFRSRDNRLRGSRRTS